MVRSPPGHGCIVQAGRSVHLQVVRRLAFVRAQAPGHEACAMGAACALQLSPVSPSRCSRRRAPRHRMIRRLRPIRTGKTCGLASVASNSASPTWSAIGTNATGRWNSSARRPPRHSRRRPVPDRAGCCSCALPGGLAGRLNGCSVAGRELAGILSSCTSPNVREPQAEVGRCARPAARPGA
jgi:hypothetical protein